MRKIEILTTGVNKHRLCHCLALAVILLLSAASLAQAQTSRSAVAYYNRANERYKKGDLDGAIADYDAALYLTRAGLLPITCVAAPDTTKETWTAASPTIP